MSSSKNRRKRNKQEIRRYRIMRGKVARKLEVAIARCNIDVSADDFWYKVLENMTTPHISFISIMEPEIGGTFDKHTRLIEIAQTVYLERTLGLEL